MGSLNRQRRGNYNRNEFSHKNSGLEGEPNALHDSAIAVNFNMFTADEIRTLSAVEVTNPNSFNQLNHPTENGLYDPSFERDNCGFGLIAHMDGEPSHWVVNTAITALARLTHRGEARQAYISKGANGQPYDRLMPSQQPKLTTFSARSSDDPAHPLRRAARP